MFNHIMVGSNDIERSERFYTALLGVLGAGAPQRNRSSSGHMRLFYRHDGKTFCVSEPIDGGPATCANGATIGFKCSSPEQVESFHDTAVAAGGTSGKRGQGKGVRYIFPPEQQQNRAAKVSCAFLRFLQDHPSAVPKRICDEAVELMMRFRFAGFVLAALAACLPVAVASSGPEEPLEKRGQVHFSAVAAAEPGSGPLL